MPTLKFAKAAQPQSRPKKPFNRPFDNFIASIWFDSEAEAIKPDNVLKAKVAFNKLAEDMGWHLAKWCFDDLLQEKSGDLAFRADGKTPNWYHELRECLGFLAFVRAGHMKEENLYHFGGIDVALATILRHDSWEDLGHTATQITDSLKDRIQRAADRKEIKTDEATQLREKSELVCLNVDLLTRKVPVLGEDGQFQRNGAGKLVKIDRYKGQDNFYYTRAFSNPITAMAKYFDGIEGMSTRIGVQSWTREDDIKYTYERRKLYGRRALDEETQTKFPFLKQAVRSADAMLGVLLVCMETVNDYASDSGQDPRDATPIRIDQYLRTDKRGFKHLPEAFHPMHVFLERMESKVEREKATDLEGRTRTLLNKAITPSLQNHFGNLKYPQHHPRPLHQSLLSVPNVA